LLQKEIQILKDWTYCMNFQDLHLIPPILRAAQEAGYSQPSPIQQQAIPIVLQGRDLLGCAQTGTGKTAAFAMPILQRLSQLPAPGKKRPIRALILTPTRELALQIDESFAAYGKYLPLRHCAIFGGVGQGPQVAQLKRGVDILTATPGRLNDLIGQGHIDLSQLAIFVLDEADRMLDMGFVNDVRRVLRYLPAQRQTLLLSATMPPEIEELAHTILTDPATVMVTPPSTTVEAIDQSIYFVDKANKRHLLAHLLQDPAIASALVFTRTKHGADRVVRELNRAGIAAMAIHGNKSQTARQNALGQFKDGGLRVLVATDIAARGIDVSGLTHVFNYDLPNVPETYVHRIGRTGRAGQPGKAISFCSAEEVPYWEDILRLTHVQVPRQEHPWPMQEQPVSTAPPRTKAKPAARVSGAAKTASLSKTTAHIAQGEIAAMEENKATTPAAPRTEGDSPAKRGRRRGGRRHKNNKTATAQAAPQAAERAASSPAPKAAKQSSAPRQNAPKTGEKQPQKQPNKKPAPQAQAKQSDKPAAANERKPQPHNAAPGSRKPDRRGEKPLTREPATPLPEVDDSIQLISRKAPTQKYASFEEYMKAHQ
jgi:ATP-dependent RNA helicase RhlE